MSVQVATLCFSIGKEGVFDSPGSEKGKGDALADSLEHDAVGCVDEDAVENSREDCAPNGLEELLRSFFPVDTKCEEADVISPRPVSISRIVYRRAVFAFGNRPEFLTGYIFRVSICRSKSGW